MIFKARKIPDSGPFPPGFAFPWNSLSQELLIDSKVQEGGICSANSHGIHGVGIEGIFLFPQKNPCQKKKKNPKKAKNPQKISTQNLGFVDFFLVCFFVFLPNHGIAGAVQGWDLPEGNELGVKALPRF